MCPNIDSLYVNQLGSRVTEVHGGNREHSKVEGGGQLEREQLEKAVGSLSEDDRQLLYCLAGSSLAPHPLFSLRQLFIQSAHPSYINLLLRMAKIQNARSFEVHVKISDVGYYEEQYFRKLRSEFPDSLFIRDENDDSKLWDTLGDANWARIWVET